MPLQCLGVILCPAGGGWGWLGIMLYSKISLQVVLSLLAHGVSRVLFQICNFDQSFATENHST